MIKKILIQNKVCFLFTLFLLIIDVTYLMLRSNDYEIIILKNAGYLYLFNIFVVILIGILTKRIFAFIFVFPIVLILLILFFLHTIFYDGTNFDNVVSPDKSRTLIIKHWVATLGESNYQFQFYQQVDNMGFLMKELKGQGVTIRVSHSESPNILDEKEVLGMDQANWIDEKKVIFPSRKGNIIINLE